MEVQQPPTAKELKLYKALEEVSTGKVLTYDDLAKLSGLTRTSAFKAAKGLESKAILVSEPVSGRRYRLKKKLTVSSHSG